MTTPDEAQALLPVTQDRQFKCAGCGNYANDVGSTLCQCATSILVRRSDSVQLVKPYLLHKEMEAIAAQREEALAKIRDGLGVAPDEARQSHSLPGDVGTLAEALKPFAEVADCYHDSEADNFEVWVDAGPERIIRASFKLAHYRKARAALAALAPSATISDATKRMEQTLGATFQPTPSALSGDAGEGE